MENFFEQLPESIRAADVLDIGVIAVFLYGGLAWMWERASRSLAIGMVLLAGLFFCARWLDMYLTTMLFQAGFVAFLLALIVVFQQDLRRVFDRVAASKWLTRSSCNESFQQTSDTLAETIAVLAERRIGALVVLVGREPVDRHIRGGVPVGGQVSLPLLCSIFDPNSPGHDGAVLVERDQITRLGVHLPLSKNLSEIGAAGTRHAAALGLSEQCDALVVAVSEERGSVSLAEDGRLELAEPAGLGAQLQHWYATRHAPQRGGSLLSRISTNLGLKLASLAGACLLWLFLAYRVETIQRTYVVPIEYRNLRERWVVVEPRPTRAALTLSGSERAFDQLDADALSVSFDLGLLDSELPRAFQSAEYVSDLPGELAIRQIEPAEVTLTVRNQAAVEALPGSAEKQSGGVQE